MNGILFFLELNAQVGNGQSGHSRDLDGDALLRDNRILDGLGNWIDRLFDGSLPKCKIDRWPLFPMDPEDSGMNEDGTGSDDNQQDKKNN